MVLCRLGESLSVPEDDGDLVLEEGIWEPACFLWVMLVVPVDWSNQGAPLGLGYGSGGDGSQTC